MKRRIVLSIVGVAVVALLVLGIPLAVAVSRLYQSEEVLRLQKEANEAMSRVSTARLENRESMVLANDHDENHFVVYDVRGRRLGGRGPARADRTVRRAITGDSANERIGDRIVVAVPITSNQKVIGALRASRSTHPAEDRTHRAWLLMALIALAAVTVASLLARWQARRLTRPIDQLVDTAVRLGGGDFSVRTESSGIEELDQLGGAMNTTADRLGHLLQRERAFSADASHQLRTPIAGLRIKVESALLVPDGDVRATLESMLPPIDRLESTVDHLFHLARDTNVDRSPLDVAGMLGQTEENWHDLLAADHRSLRIVIEENLPAPVVAAPAVLQILDVLVANAKRHGAGIVTVAARSSVSGAVVIQVRDEGTAVLDGRHIFERRNHGHHGVGLALARTLAEAEGARLVLEQPGPGPVFALVIPTDEA